MADASNVRHDTIVVPETMSPAQVRALAQRKAQAQVGDDDLVAFLHLHGSRPVGTAAKQIVDQVVDSSLLKRYGTLDEQAAAITFLASDEASYITGTVLPVAGGDLG
jgi:NAD(P)-dependent dehydrogenase (short-subunit alcohol dehydrogenase family)